MRQLLVAAGFCLLLVLCRSGIASDGSEEQAPQSALKIGAPVPRLDVGVWMRGEPVKQFKKGTVYVVEFWATWCGPCIAAMPHIQELQDQYAEKGLVVIGANVMERDVGALQAFIKKDKHTYRIATDLAPTGQRGGALKKAWLDAVGSSALPQTFIVDRQTRIAWIGHPVRMDGPLAAVMEGEFDAQKQAEIDRKFRKLNAELGQCISAKHWDKGLSVLDRMDAVDPASSHLNYGTRIRFLVRTDRYEEAHKFAEKVARESTRPVVRVRLADALLKAPDATKIDTALVLKLAEEGAKHGASEDPLALSALGRAYDRVGRDEDAIATWKAMLKLNNPLVWYTEREPNIRVIGSRKATPSQRRQYEEEH